ncbi:hypothetical protein EMPS_03707 [Entomortierella parvispora]|uniref:Uncharacterized protein n=1 Tax=Entomortierella parvispora TaxID=205924 RepID=A0A9P3H7W1_9FUNG|nr:hypothetical protein EMPS_03707 [Entomortierella parvispora]
MSTLSVLERFLLLPELAEYLSGYLSIKDIGRLSVASKHIQWSIAPSFWRNYVLDKPDDDVHRFPSPSPGLSQNLELVRSIEFRTLHTGIWDILLDPHLKIQAGIRTVAGELPVPAPLTSLIYTGLRHNGGTRPVLTDEEFDKFFLLLKRTPTLETLCLPSDLLEEIEKFIPILAQMPHLKSITLVEGTRGPMENSRAFAFLGACLSFQDLKVLRCSFRTFRGDDVGNGEERQMFDWILGAIKIHKKEGHFPLGLHELELPAYQDRYPESFLVPFYTSGFPSLEVFHVPYIRSSYNVRLETALQNHVPKLRDVQMPAVGLRHEIQEASTLFTSVKCCSRGENERKAGNGCRSIETMFMGWCSGDTWIFYCRNTLESFIMSSTPDIWTHNVQQILSICPRLKTMKISGTDNDGFLLDVEDFPVYDEAGDEKAARDLATDPRRLIYGNVTFGNFVCKGMKTLSLVSGSTWKTDPMRNRGFYTQLGQLKELEELTYGYELAYGYNAKLDRARPALPDLTLDSQAGGRLDELRGLKKLRVLHIQGRRTHHSIGQAEVEWMEREWPLLEKVILSPKDEDKQPSAESGHWKWLMSKRHRLTVQDQ